MLLSKLQFALGANTKSFSLSEGIKLCLAPPLELTEKKTFVNTNSPNSSSQKRLLLSLSYAINIKHIFMGLRKKKLLKTASGHHNKHTYLW